MDNTTEQNTPYFSFKIVTLNARGLNTKHKRLEIFDELKQKTSDTIFIQDANCISQEVFHSWGMELGSSRGNSPKSSI